MTIESVAVQGTLAYLLEQNLKRILDGKGDLPEIIYVNGNAPLLFSKPGDDVLFTQLLQKQGKGNGHT